ncbi:conserved hypothetical protein [Beutenbergia cavernae DSM 12333]|uniref:Alkaline phosphatase n=1 Tax=Beutenbergia cavernae (strain ATCC BAA-8 / DSM 12333 / CCUG 43141 / JCM 11478 / NBRC 16432 / NCIMB 13614 / HKI 0122) TaxID=471853 RepID=C5BWI2_BEUC1|nr:conserved hypothetical protein [Beutenbergia cavernae DSM 12333]
MTVLAASLTVFASASPARAETAGQPGEQVVLVGVGGLSWSDVSPETPALWDLAQRASLGSAVVRSIRTATCPADGWLAVSSGARAADESGRCRTLAEPVAGAVPGWPDYVAAAEETGYGARLGTLGNAVSEAEVPATSIGPGAAIALADSDGAVQGTSLRRAPTPVGLEAQVTAALTTSALVVVDAGTVRDLSNASLPNPPAPTAPTTPEEARTAQVDVVERRIAAVLAAVQEQAPDATVILASLADSGSAPGLRLLAATGPGLTDGSTPFGESLLVTTSTRQTGYVQTTDLLPGLVSALDLGEFVPTGTLVGSPMRATDGPASAEGRLDAVLDQDVHAQAVRPIVAPFYLFLVVGNIALYAAVAIGLKRPAAFRIREFLDRRLSVLRGKGLRRGLAAQRRRVLLSLRIVSLAIGALPVASFLANLLPWWRVDPPALGLAVAIIVWDAAIVAVALLRPWRDWVLGPLAVVAGITAAVLALDVLTGARLQISAVMGVPTLVAGRFYGFNNTAFALFTVSTILVVVAVTNPLVRAGRRLLAAAVVAGIGIVATVLDGAPGIGADFGGPPALVPAFTILALMAAGVRLTWKRIAVVLGGAAAVTVLFAFVDWLRPADDRTHLGRFIDTVLDGGLWDVVFRKLEANLRILANNRPLTLLAIAGVALVVFVLARPVKIAILSPGGGKFDWLSAGAPISQMGQASPMLRPGLVAMAVAMGIGFVVNDSGIAIPAIGISVAVPLLLAACASWMLTLSPPAVPVDAPLLVEPQDSSA